MIIYNREISSNFTEYENKYDKLLKNYLSKHDDFSEIYFVETEFEFYSKCYYSSNITETFDEEGNPVYSVNNGDERGLIVEIYESLRDKSLKVNDGWNIEQSNIYKATFKRIMNFLDSKLNELKCSNKNNIKSTTSDITTNKYSAKWHAVLYLLELENKGQNIPVNKEGCFIKSKIEEIGRERVGNGGQSFYRQVTQLADIVKSKADLIPYMGENWKNEIIKLTGDNTEIVNYIEKHY